MSKDKTMDPMSHETVETDGIYADEAGREVTLKRGDKFPADLVLGETTWEMKGFSLNEAEIDHQQKENTPPRLHVKTGDR
ncbi:hypothetical protein ACI48J_23990 [Paenibacillus chitinolyticus]|uniref:hypothetical protein n=1 Tax=Paenibacillus chitinolyticus TaxID=79263 RepID=UPI002DBE0DC2|nr:hypothetical protein [Paenibacillus chitinolyticus]MEC0248015.1 hypothetical protein [Paenibacillus chitinolyticus]